MGEEAPPRSRGGRLIWFVVLWMAGVLSVAAIVWLIRVVLEV